MPARSVRQSLNKAFLKRKPLRDDVEHFRVQLQQLLERSAKPEHEEYHKNNLREFLRATQFGEHYCNTADRIDLVIHAGKTANTPVAVLIEHKRPDNVAEFPRPDDLNRKATQELLLYYLRERLTNNNLDLRHLIVTNNFEWFCFDARDFERLFARDKALTQRFRDFERGAAAGGKTSDFYRDVAAPALAAVADELPFTHFDLRQLNLDAPPAKLVPLFKLLSPEHLLKLPFANDSNSLDRRFYDELLHLIGLTKTKVKGKKLIIFMDRDICKSLVLSELVGKHIFLSFPPKLLSEFLSYFGNPFQLKLSFRGPLDLFYS